MVLGIFLISATSSYATHLRAGEITVEKVDGCGSLTVKITITVFTDTGSDINFGDGFLFFGDGTDPIVLPTIEEDTRPDLGPEVGIASFSIEYTYSSPGVYKIGYLEPNRNDDIVNVGNSVNTTFYVETQIIISPFVGCNNSPVLLIPPIDRACPGVAFYHNPGAFDPDGDSIAFELVIPKKEKDTNVDNWTNPADLSDSNEDETGAATFSIDPITGELEWNAPTITGEYTVAFIVKEYRKLDGEYVQLGYVTRDMQIIVEDCDNERPELEIPDDICVEAGTLIDAEILGFDPDFDSVKIEVFSEILNNGNVSYSPNPARFQTVEPNGAKLNFQWQTTCADVRTNAYQVIFKITDKPPRTGSPPIKQPSIVSFATWNITVVGPSPEVTGVTQDGQGLLLNWDRYNQICQDNLGRDIASNFEIWRRIDSNPYMPDECETGIREDAGYELIGTAPIDATSFKDNNLVAAAKYCYRIVAVFPTAGAPRSIVSDEVCYEFVPADKPVITHVSIDKTGTTDGEIIVGWREPFPQDLDPNVYPHPYRYIIERNEGANNTGGFTEVATVTVNSATTDSLGIRDTGLNTRDLIYNYRIRLEIPNGPGGSNDPLFSEQASTVRLDPTPLFQEIELNWNAQVPWSNVISSPPGSEHLVYRGFEGDSEEDLVLIARVDVNGNGFRYLDAGPLDNNLLYCYRVLTKGTYGNPNITTPLLNYSQITCTQPSDSIPPCAPLITVNNPSCEEFLATASCNFDNFSNELTWDTDFGSDCQNDIRTYEIWYKPDTESEYRLVGTSPTTSFIHDRDENGQLLTSFKGCYKVRAIDRSNNVGEFSEEVCVDNCPYYELPNVFTPNGDGCNDVFSAYHDRGGVDESGFGKCGDIDASKCARFVRRVDLTIYNRWGGVVYTYTGFGPSERTDENSNSIYIDWDGVGDNGNEVASGVYYYQAEVTFDVVDPSTAKQTIKGWVQILR